MEAPPPDPAAAGGACSALRSQAEPGNEKSLLHKTDVPGVTWDALHAAPNLQA
ncbi:hypothetical protein RISK_004291 [Rhodopirellula islandica]|uniref:Uncharacterized protein n=1 Tax=Rhodopirellula islandica TaxID=595434 RepID=A0A0J1EEI0_RHOIS|nr:hypothetical protein RISK_004291 [Rhodopirellula islandica]